jgi:UDP-N-acetylmuramyl pentapeptide synthase
MRELGKETKNAHEEIAKNIKEVVDFPILIGPLMKKYVAPLLKNSGKNYKAFEKFTKAKNFIKSEIKNGDVILVKGSQNTLLLERVVEMLLKNKEKKRKLCRQRDFWEKKRKQIP